MKKLLLLTALLLAMTLMMFSCELIDSFIKDQNQPQDDVTEEIPVVRPDENPDENTDDIPDVVINEDYFVTVATAGKMPMAEIMVRIHVLKDGKLGEAADVEKLTDNEGRISANLPNDKSYAVCILAGIPEGYADAEEYYPISAGENTVTLTSSVIADTGLDGVSYKLGDVMHDYTFTTVDGEVMTLSGLLETKKAVLLNFWFVGCTWCEVEFPMIDFAQAKYADDVAVIAVNPFVEDTPELIREFREMMGLNLEFAQVKGALADAFGVEGYPTSVLIDRYGVITLIESGVIRALRDIDTVFDYYTADDYTQTLISEIGDLSTETESEIVFPEGITEIDAYAFSGYYNITSLVIPDTVTKIGNGAFQFCDNLVSVVIPDSVTEIGENAFLGCASLTDVVLPKGLTRISKGMFQTCYSLTDIDIPEGVTEICNSAFLGCIELVNVNLPESVTVIEFAAFAVCNFTEFRIPSGVAGIDNQAFCYNLLLKTLYIPKSVTYIGTYAFYECFELTDIYYEGTEEEWAQVVIGYGNECFKGATVHFNCAE